MRGFGNALQLEKYKKKMLNRESYWFKYIYKYVWYSVFP